MDAFYSTGQVARELKVTTATIRKLCDVGAIRASRSSGGHYRISAAELERLKKLDALPPVPRATLAPSPNSGLHPMSKRENNGLFADPSAEVVEAAEEAVVSDRQLTTSRNKLESLKIRKEATEIEDFFEGRERRRQAEYAEERRREEERAAEQERHHRAALAADRRREFNAFWLRYAVKQKPNDAPEEIALEIHREVSAVLADIEPDPELPTEGGVTGIAVAALARVARCDNDRVRLVVDAAVARALRPWKLTQDKRKAVREAVESLPIDMRWRKEWKDRASEIAFESIRRSDVPHADIVARAELALRPLVAEFEHTEKIARARSPSVCRARIPTN